MTAATLPNMKSRLKSAVKPVGYYMARPYRLFREYDRADFRPDFMAGLTVARDFATPGHRLRHYCRTAAGDGFVRGRCGRHRRGVVGFFNQTHNGPTNAISLLILRPSL